MSANFWELQRRAKKKTKWYLAFFIIITLGMAVFIEWALRELAQGGYQSEFPLLGFVFLALTFGVAGFQYSMFQSYGGSYVAQSVGGRLISPDTTDQIGRAHV